jgi:hypothetical protein
MRSRSIEYYLSQEERDLISTFIERSIERFEAYDGRIRMTPRRFNTDELQRLYIRKYNEWEEAVKTQPLDSSGSYLDVLRESGRVYPCPIENFLKMLMQVIEQAIPPDRYSNMLRKLEADLSSCDFSCPCPAEP